MSRKQIFGAQIENNMLDNHTDQREMVLLFLLHFYSVLQRTRRSRVTISISRRAQRRRQAALLRVFTAFTLQERQPRRIVGSSKTSVLSLKTCSIQML